MLQRVRKVCKKFKNREKTPVSLELLLMWFSSLRILEAQDMSSRDARTHCTSTHAQGLGKREVKTREVK